MKIYVFFTIFLLHLFSPVANAQKHDYMWPLGMSQAVSEFRFFCRFDENNEPTMVVRTDTISIGRYSASFCDKDGKLRYFSNGLRIFDANASMIENGNGLNPTIPNWQTSYSYPASQSGFFLEKPDDSNIVYFISLDIGPHPAGEFPYEFVGQNLVVATIDGSANNDAGKVVEKNKILLTGTLMAPAACRHANGRDWWILVSNADENRHYRILLTPDGFSSPETQLIGTKPSPIPYNGELKSCQIVGNCFSARGNYYADINDYMGFSIFSFDRCSGLLSAERRVDFLPFLPNYPDWYKNGNGTGAVFSPDEKLFYKTVTYHPGAVPWAPAGFIPYLLQYDLSEPDISLKVDTINTTDWSFPFNMTEEYFFGAELAPDGRIYIVHSGLGYCTVQYPNVRGRDCKFIHDKPHFGVVIGSAIPCMPNYRLGPLDGSGCDTLGLNNLPVANFRVDDTLGVLHSYFYDLSHHEPTAWLWNFGDGATSTEQSPLHEYDTPGVYEVCLTVSNAYGSDTYCRQLYLGVSSTYNPATPTNGTISVHPNPFTQRLVVSLKEKYDHSVFLLYDGLGRLVRSTPVPPGDAFEMPVGDLKEGMYFWEMVGNGTLVGSGKVVKTL